MMGSIFFLSVPMNLKTFLKKYLIEHQAEYLLEQKTFVYDSDCDEFFESDIQEFYKIWLMA